MKKKSTATTIFWRHLNLHVRGFAADNTCNTAVRHTARDCAQEFGLCIHLYGKVEIERKREGERERERGKKKCVCVGKGVERECVRECMQKFGR